MRPLLHLVSLVLVLPSVLLAAAFILLGRAIATKSLLELLDRVVNDAAWIMPWGLLLGLAAILLIAAGGFFAQTRRAAGLVVAGLGAGSLVVLLVTIGSHAQLSLGDVPFFTPGVIAIGIGLWLAFAERGRGGED